MKANSLITKLDNLSLKDGNVSLENKGNGSFLVSDHGDPSIQLFVRNGILYIFDLRNPNGFQSIYLSDIKDVYFAEIRDDFRSVRVDLINGDEIDIA